MGAAFIGYLLMLISSYDFKNRKFRQTNLTIGSQFTSRYSCDFSKKKKKKGGA